MTAQGGDSDPVLFTIPVNDIAAGTRTDPGALAMKAAMPKLTQGGMIAVAAYLATLPPDPGGPGPACSPRPGC